ncbi:hypothetical protein GQ53DRAFT_745011 [Thozetella sp. PMI_491]|nr:hypothetical protein GQ53DRAFT_745011 [Thozetella sp. PMI_491]
MGDNPGKLAERGDGAGDSPGKAAAVGESPSPLSKLRQSIQSVSQDAASELSRVMPGGQERLVDDRGFRGDGTRNKARGSEHLCEMSRAEAASGICTHCESPWQQRHKKGWGRVQASLHTGAKSSARPCGRCAANINRPLHLRS